MRNRFKKSKYNLNQEVAKNDIRRAHSMPLIGRTHEPIALKLLDKNTTIRVFEDDGTASYIMITSYKIKFMQRKQA